MEKRDINQLIVDWAKAQRAVSTNTQLLLSCDADTHEVVMDMCINHMEAWNEAQSRMLSLAVEKNLPLRLVRYIEANNDRGCPKCWTSSAWDKHPDCKAKIAELFSARESLLEFADEVG